MRQKKFMATRNTREPFIFMLICCGPQNPQFTFDLCDDDDADADANTRVEMNQHLNILHHDTKRKRNSNNKNKKQKQQKLAEQMKWTSLNWIAFSTFANFKIFYLLITFFSFCVLFFCSFSLSKSVRILQCSNWVKARPECHSGTKTLRRTKRHWSALAAGTKATTTTTTIRAAITNKWNT